MESTTSQVVRLCVWYVCARALSELGSVLNDMVGIRVFHKLHVDEIGNYANIGIRGFTT